MGIGTTTPTASLHATGTIRFSTFGAGTLETDAAGNLSVSSDERLKNIEGDFEQGLDELLGINPIQYTWNEDSGYEMETVYSGFSAQNVEEFIPEAVSEDGRGFLSLSTRPILAAVVNAIQEMWDVVTGNQERIEELETEVDDLKDQLEEVLDELDIEIPEKKEDFEDESASEGEPEVNDEEASGDSKDEFKEEEESGVSEEKTEDEESELELESEEEVEEVKETTSEESEEVEEVEEAEEAAEKDSGSEPEEVEEVVSDPKLLLKNE
jgi:hypothetical protein